MTLGKLLAGIPVLLVDLFRSTAQETAVTARRPSIGSASVAGIRSNTEAEKAHKAERMSLRSFRTSSPLVQQTLPAAAFVGLALVARGEIGVSTSSSRSSEREC